MAKTARSDKKSRELGADGTKAAVNTDARKEIINNTVREIHSLDGQIKTLQAERREIINKNIKGDLDMKVADFNAVLRVASLEDENRAKFLDTLRETFIAVGIGAQLSFLDAIDTDSKPAAAGAKLTPGYTAELGRAAARAGKNADTNPHKEGTQQHQSWHAGWMEQQQTMAGAMGGKRKTEGAPAH
jgi:hypothetical protein